MLGIVLSDIIANDPELLEEYRKMEREYDNNNLNQKDNLSSYKTYTHFKIIHYDHGRRIECRIKESDIPLHIRQKYTD